MKWNEHSKLLEGAHAPFGASKYFWLNYDKEKALAYYKSLLAKKAGTEYHEIAKQCIDHGIQLKGRNTLARYVNDAIGFRMRTEQLLVYSKYFFGTADAIIFQEKDKLLRIHDLKTGTIPAKLDQLLIYDALFCLEYRIDPSTINHELRIYQNNEILSDNPDADQIAPIMEKIQSFNQFIEEYEEGIV